MRNLTIGETTLYNFTESDIGREERNSLPDLSLSFRSDEARSAALIAATLMVRYHVCEQADRPDTSAAFFQTGDTQFPSLTLSAIV